MIVGGPVDSAFLLRGVGIDLSIVVPVGPIGVLSIRRTLAEGRAIGFVTGLGAATADATYGTVTVLGVFLGSALWWLFLSGTVSILRSSLESSALVRVNRASGAIIGGFGVVVLASLR